MPTITIVHDAAHLALLHETVLVDLVMACLAYPVLEPAASDAASVDWLSGHHFWSFDYSTILAGPTICRICSAKSFEPA